MLDQKGFYYDLYNSQFIGASVEEEPAQQEASGFGGFPGGFGGFPGGRGGFGGFNEKGNTNGRNRRPEGGQSGTNQPNETQEGTVQGKGKRRTKEQKNAEKPSGTLPALDNAAFI